MCEGLQVLMPGSHSLVSARQAEVCARPLFRPCHRIPRTRTALVQHHDTSHARLAHVHSPTDIAAHGTEPHAQNTAHVAQSAPARIRPLGLFRASLQNAPQAARRRFRRFSSTFRHISTQFPQTALLLWMDPVVWQESGQRPWNRARSPLQLRRRGEGLCACFQTSSPSN